eukprot:TRINITY_DN12550_c0_g1_i1.p1 TRINITY_DN12550_c0_g1~~TRINITY_DN12550_c0_g1_i1.p1  ORF type:complete len:636 (-),score=91.88 TRINITY_DN12550_c0_g1_i1:403-2310(-)
MAAAHGGGQHQNASLYVGDLPPDVTEAMLFDLFKAVGPVLSIRVCRDAVTRRSLGYAYVNFQNPTDAERALETLNYHRVKDRPIRIMWSHRDPGLRKSGSGNVFIKNLHPEIDNQTLYDTFSQFGNILSCKVSTNQGTGESRGYGFVHFESEDSAKAAIEKVNGMLLKETKVFVGKFVRRSQRLQQNQSSYTNVYIKHLAADIDKEKVDAYFQRYGEFQGSAVQRDKKDRPFAFINFETHEAADQAVAECHDKTIPELCDGETKLYVQRAQRKTERYEDLKKKFAQIKAKRINEYSGHNLYVKNLDDNVDDAGLRASFEKFGEISSAKVMLDDKDPPISKGFGFVCFKDVESANRAIAEMNGQMIGSKPLYVNVAQRKEVRRATLEIQYAARLGRGVGGPSMPPVPQMGGFPPMYQAGPYGYAGPSPQAGYPGYPMGQPGARGMMPPKWGGQGAPGMPPAGAAAGAFPPGAGGMRPQPQRRATGRGPQQIRGGPAGAVAGGRGGGAAKPAAPYAFKSNARNRDGSSGPSAGAAPYNQMAMQPGVGPSGQEPLTAAALANMNPDQQRNTLGEQLFQRIQDSHPDHAAKITGMLLEMDITEQLNLLESPDMLSSKIHEALEVLRQHEPAEGAAKTPQ